MLPAWPDSQQRLRLLAQRWHAEAVMLADTLTELDGARERSLLQARWQRQVGNSPEASLLRHCSLLATECEAVARELTHVRMALHGIQLELDHARSTRPMHPCHRDRTDEDANGPTPGCSLTAS